MRRSRISLAIIGATTLPPPSLRGEVAGAPRGGEEGGGGGAPPASLRLWKRPLTLPSPQAGGGLKLAAPRDDSISPARVPGAQITVLPAPPPLATPPEARCPWAAQPAPAAPCPWAGIRAAARGTAGRPVLPARLKPRRRTSATAGPPVRRPSRS